MKGNVFIQNIPKYELITLPSLWERAKNEFYCKLRIIGGLNSITVEWADAVLCRADPVGSGCGCSFADAERN